MDHNATDKPICPYCNKYMGQIPNLNVVRMDIFQCLQCEKPVIVTLHKTISYTTQKIGTKKGA